VETRRQVTEEDILMTEALIARSYGRLKQSVVQAPSQVLGSVGGTIRKHPLGAAAAAVVAGITLYGLFRLVTRQGVVKERVTGRKEYKSRPDMTMEILSVILPLAAPYVAGLIQSYLGKIHPGERD
jgi:hypothetical protein